MDHHIENGIEKPVHIIIELDNVGVRVNEDFKGQGKITLRSDLFIWESLDKSYKIEHNYQSILMHALCKEEASHIYTQIETPGDPYDEESILEVLFYVSQEQDLQALYNGFCQGSVLNSDIVNDDADDGQAPLYFDQNLSDLEQK